MKKIIILLSVLLSQIALAQNVPSYVPSNGLLAWLPFTGNTIDSSGNGNNGVANSAILTTDRFGNSNKAYAFNGSSSKVTIAHNAALNLMGNFTISIWYKSINPPANTAYHTLIGKRDCILFGNQSDPVPWIMSINYNDPTNYKKFATWTNTGGTWNWFVTDSLVTVGVWQHAVLRNLNDTFSYFLNGQKIHSVSWPVSKRAANIADVIIGSANRPGYEWFEGSLDDIGIWNRALTNNEIQSLYLGCQGSTQTPSVLYNNGNLSVSGGPFVSYQWFLNGVAIQGANNATYVPILNGIYSVSVSSGSCGSYTSQGYVMNSVGISSISENKINVYPNPAQDKLYIKEMPDGMQVKIYNAIGQLMLESTQKEINITSLNKGNYFISLFDEQKQLIQNQLFIKE